MEVLWPRLTASLRRMREREQTLLLTGHSMGGALAVVAAAKFAADGAIPIAGLYTFGQPTVAEPAFETELATHRRRYFRFVNSVDMVPGFFVDAAFLPAASNCSSTAEAAFTPEPSSADGVTGLLTQVRARSAALNWTTTASRDTCRR